MRKNYLSSQELAIDMICDRARYIPFKHGDLSSYAWFQIALMEKDYKYVETFWLSLGYNRIRPYFQCQGPDHNHPGVPIPRNWLVI